MNPKPKIVKLKFGNWKLNGVKVGFIVWSQFWMEEYPRKTWWVRYVEGNKWKYERFYKFREALNRAKEIAVKQYLEIYQD